MAAALAREDSALSWAVATSAYLNGGNPFCEGYAGNVICPWNNGELSWVTKTQSGGDSGNGLRDLFKNNKACADLLGGTKNALKLLAAARRSATDRPGWTPPKTFAGDPKKNAFIIALVASNTHNVLAGVDFGSAGPESPWDGRPFTVFANASYSALNSSQRKTIFIHDLHHVSSGNTLASELLDFAGNLEYNLIAFTCKTEMPSPPAKK